MPDIGFVELFTLYTLFPLTKQYFRACLKIPVKYIRKLDSKIDKYSSRITSKTEKTLNKKLQLGKQDKILLENVSPEITQRLFNDN